MCRRKQKNMDPLFLCSDLIDKEISNLTYSVPSLNVGQDFRCSGCSTVTASLNSRNFSKILQACPNKCDRHKVIQECEDRYKKELKKLQASNINKTDKNLFFTPIRRTTSCITDCCIKQTDSMNSTPTKDFHLKKIRNTSHKTEETYLLHWSTIKEDFRIIFTPSMMASIQTPVNTQWE